MLTNEHVKEYLQTRLIAVPNEWVDQCIQFLKGEVGFQGNTSSGLKEKVYEQWLHTDLAELGSFSLPFSLNNIKCTHIRGKFILQINKIHDIGLSSYKQFQKLKKSENENVDVSAEKTFQPSWQPKSSRMLMLELTDGTSIVNGIEYKPISSISLSIAPGTKISLNGDIEVRRGVLLLTQNHIENLGGGVEALATTHAQDNVLRRTLGLEETNSPVIFSGASLQSVENKKVNCDELVGWKTSQQVKIEQKSFTTNSSNHAKPNPLPSAVIEDDFDDFFNGDIEMALMEAEGNHVYQQLNPKLENVSASITNIPKPPVNRNLCNITNFTNKSKLQEIPPSLNRSNQSKFSASRTEQQYEMPNIKRERCNSFNASSTSNIIENEVIDIIDSDDEALFLAAEEFEDEIPSANRSKNYMPFANPIPKKLIKLDDTQSICFQSNPDAGAISSQNSLPFQYLISMPKTVFKKEIYTIKGFVMTLISKLKQQNGINLLTVTLNDGTDSCDVDFHNNVIQKMLGLTANELSERISQSKKDPSLRPAITKKMNNFQTTLINMCCLFKLELAPSVKRPTVIEIIPINSLHLYQLKNRMKRKK